LNQFFNHFGFEQHPDKTFIGRTNKGFDWLGFQLNHTGIVGVSVRSLENHKLKLRQLYEQARKQKLSQQDLLRRVAKYKQHWLRWVKTCLTVSLPITCLASNALKPNPDL
ncbi:MAG: hypothetical protein Q9M28_05240, partial [Mariprofundaceae bacterium]|nr:hypothetical protein [Mariprofundaceae bacterium]